VQNEGDVARQAHRVKPRVEIPRVIDQVISPRRRFSRLAHADQVGGIS
jgi:hypothetical protein